MNSILINGYLFREAKKIFFLPENSNENILLFDADIYGNHSNIFSQKIISKNKTIYETQGLGVNYDYGLRDSVLVSKISLDDIMNKNEMLIIEINKELDILEIKHVNCKNDTLLMNFFPTKKVFYKNINKSAFCL
jgi:hypothetical protein